MRAAIVCMQSLNGPGADSSATDDNSINECQHALAIAEALEGSSYSPCIICDFQSPLAQMPFSVPRLCIRNRGLGPFFKLWQWQRSQGDMLIIAVGEASLKHGLRLLRMGRKHNRQLIAAFLLVPPAREAAPMLAKASQCLCGSAFILHQVDALLGNAAPKPQLAITAPGVDLADYPGAPCAWNGRDRFIFGMAESLMPDSGALLAVRAMAALWQNENIPPWEMRMFGWGPRYDEVIEEAANLGVLPRLAILDDQPLGEVSRLCHVWLAPGTAPDERPDTLWAGFGCGLPLIYAESALHDERIKDKTAAIGIKSENPQALARVMLDLMRKEELRERLGKASWAQRDQIGLEAMAARICALLPKPEEKTPPRKAGAEKNEISQDS